MDAIAELFRNASSWLSLLPRITVRNLAEIVIISVLVYEILVWIKNTRAWILLKGLLVVLAFAAWLVWEVCVMIYPERFCEMTNAALKCSECTDKLCTQYCQKLR